MRKHATRIREVRKRSGRTLLELATELGTTPQTVQRLETDNMTISVKWLFAIARVLGVRPAELLEDPAEFCTNPDDILIAELRDRLVKARRHTQDADDALLAVLEATGKLAQSLIERRAGRPWEDVRGACADVAATAIRLAVDLAPPAAEEPIKLVVNS